MRLQTLLLVVLTAAAALAAPLTLPDVGVAFTPPPGFKRWNEQQIRAKYPPVRPPKYVFAPDARGRVSVAVTTARIPLRDEELPKLRQFLEQTYSGFPGIKWFAREELTLQGKKWVHLEFETKAIDTTIHNDTYTTLRKGMMVGVNYNAITAVQARHQAGLRKSRDTLRLLP